MSESSFCLHDCKYAEISRNLIQRPIGDAVLLSGESISCFESNEISGVGFDFAAIALRDTAGANIQLNLISDSRGTAVHYKGPGCKAKMERNIVLNCFNGVSVS